MPKKPISFENAVVYKIVCKDLDVKDVYVGSTTNFTKRKCSHKAVCNNEHSKHYNINLYSVIRKAGGFENWDMIVICKASECLTSQELKKKEREYMELLGANLNMVIPGRTVQEYQQDNKEKIAKYYHERKDERNQYYREYYNEHYKNNESYKAIKKEYYEKNKDTKNEINKRYYLKHKDEIKEKNAMKQKERYQTDEEYRQRLQQIARDNYKKRKLEEAEYKIQIGQFLEQNSEEEF